MPSYEENGVWIETDLRISELNSDGLPKPGDLVEVVYDSRVPVWTGIAKIIKQRNTTVWDSFYAPEYGMDIIYGQKL
jgi:hypothetical protein